MSFTSLPTEIQNLILHDLVQETKALSHFSQTCRSIYNAVWPLLYKTIVVNTRKGYLNAFKTLTVRPDLAEEVQTMHLVGDPLTFNKEEQDGLVEDRWSYQDVLDTMLQKMLPNLVNLTEFAFDSTLEMRPGIITGLQALPKLCKLKIVLNEHLHCYTVDGDVGWDRDESRCSSMKAVLAVGHFRNLTSLELFNIYGNAPKTLTSLAHTLVACPHLTQLTLGLSEDAMHSRNILYAWIFDVVGELCVEIAQLATEVEGLQMPVLTHLEKLSFMDGFELHGIPAVNERLSTVIDLSKLKFFSYNNGCRGENAQYPPEAYDVLIQKAVNLKELEVEYFTEPVFGFLEQRDSIKRFSFSEELNDLDLEDVSSERFRKIIEPPRSLKIDMDDFDCPYDCEDGCEENHWQSWLEERAERRSL